MADKEVTVYIIDLGHTMGDRNCGRTESDLDWCMRYVWDKISTTVAPNRKTWYIGVLGLRTKETQNAMSSDEGYENISVLQELGLMTLSSMRSLQKKIKNNEEHTLGDAISAVVLAIGMIADFTKKLKFRRKIIMVTDGLAPIDGDNLEDIAKKLTEFGIELTILGVDFDDAEYGFKEEIKPKLKAKNENLLRFLCEQCNGIYGTVAEAIAEMETPRLKAVAPYQNYEGLLTLGNMGDGADGMPQAMSISIKRYFKTHLAIPSSATTVIGGETPSSVDAEESNYSTVRNMRTYRVQDPSAPGGKKDVEYDTLAKGYEYGRTVVHISESEHNITKLETKKSFSIVGFIPWERYEPFLTIGDCCQTVASHFNKASIIALSSLINALWELESFAVARLVPKDGKEPQLLLLMPGPKATPECLYDVPLPFAEDVRMHPFPPLGRVMFADGTTMKHRSPPSRELTEAMSDYVDIMDLSQHSEDKEGSQAEYACIDDTYNPLVNRLNQAIRMRASYPEEPIGKPARILIKYSCPPESLTKIAKDQIDDLISAAEVKKVPPRAKGKRSQRETVKPLSGLDIDALLSGELVIPDSSSAATNTQSSGTASAASLIPQTFGKDGTGIGSNIPCAGIITTMNSIPEFKQALSVAVDLDAIKKAVWRMGEIVRSLITDSLGDSNYDRAAENMRIMRDELVAMEEPDLYNQFVRTLKRDILAGALGSDRREMWWQVQVERLGLISAEQSEVSEVGAKEAQEFYTARVA